MLEWQNGALHPFLYEYDLLMCALEGLAGLFGVH